MTNLTPKHHIYSIHTLLEHLIQGKYGLPDFQRDFVWREKQVVDLLDSIYRGIFIGVPTVVEHNGMMNPKNLQSVADLHDYLGFDCSSYLESSMLIIDGQQRLTSILYLFYCETLALRPIPKENRLSIKKAEYLLKNVRCSEKKNSHSLASPANKKHIKFVIFVKHNSDPQKTLFNVLKIESVNKKNSRKYNEIKKNYLTTQEIYDLHLMALDQEYSYPDPGLIEDWLISTGRTSIHLGVKDAARVLSHIAHRIFVDYQIIISQLSPKSSIGATSSLLNTLAVTFDRINSKGITISLFDIAVAAFYKYGNIKKPFEDLQDHLNEGYGRGSLGIPFLGSGKGIRGEDILRIMALILRVTVKRAEILGGIHDKLQIAKGGEIVETIGKRTIDAKDPLSDVWKYAEDSYIKALERLRKQYGVYSFDPSKQKSSMPYSSMLPVLAAFLHVAHYHPNAAAHRDCVEAMIDFWYWISVFAERYSSSADTTSETDVNQFHDWVNSLGTDSIKLPNFLKNYCGKDIPVDLAETKQGQAIFRGILNIIYKEGALDWLDNNGVKIPKLKELSPEDLNQDHIFPKSPPKDTPYPGSIMEIPIDTIKNSILNVTLISEGANKKKKSKAPSRILTDLKDLCSKYPPHPPLSDLLKGHLINPAAEKAMEDNKIEDFLKHRQEAIIDKIQELMDDILERLKPCPGMFSGCKITFRAEVPQQKSPQDQE